MPSLALNSRSWASAESESTVGRLRARRRVCWKERSSCLRFALSSAVGVARIVLALERRLEITSFAYSIGSDGEDEAAESGFEAADSGEGEGESEAKGESAVLAAGFRLFKRSARLSFVFLGAPVA